jgi:hypothetical protein
MKSMSDAGHKRNVIILAVIVTHISVDALSAQIVWSGYDVTFSKATNTNYTLPENQDRFTDNVAFTRGDTGGLINVAAESNYIHFTSPLDTEWATDLTSDETIAATNWQALVATESFTNWIEAFGGQFTSGANIVGRNAVVHLITDDIYLDLRFTGWITFRGGGFAYFRSAIPPPTGDYNNDLIVNAADYTVWRNTLGQSTSFEGAGADGDANGQVDIGDYTFWKSRFGNVINGAGAMQGKSLTVPEPTTGLLLFVLSGLLSVRSARARSRTHNPHKTYMDNSSSSP